MNEWRTKTALEQGEAIARGTLDPVALVESYLEAISAHPYASRIYSQTMAERARSEASAAHARAQSGSRRSLLDGVPVSWKDLIDSAGTATEAGSALLKGRVPDRDATVLANATAAGCVALGKTHMTELAFSGLGLNPVTASPPCVNDVDAVSGGSSSGAATSVAFDLAAIAVGSDTGGSVRVPAAWNDLVGLKTTAGLLPMDGILPLCPRFDTIGPLGRSVADTAAMLAVLAGGKPADLNEVDLTGAKLMVLETVAFDDLDTEVAHGVAHAIEQLERAGAEISSVKLPFVADAMELSAILFAPEAYGNWKDLIEAHPEKMFPPIRDRFRAGANVLASDYIAAWIQLDAYRRQYLEETTRFDAVLVPSVAITPPNRAQMEQGGDAYVRANLLSLRNTRIGNLMGLCALSLPTTTPSVGLGVMGAPGEESKLLRLGAAAEKALGSG